MLEEHKENRKAKMAKRLLREALIEELGEKKLSEVTITELCERADLNRSTFYAHYKDVFALFDEIEDGFLSNSLSFSFDAAGGAQKKNIEKITRYLYDHREEFGILMDNGQLIRKFTERCVEFMKENIRACPEELLYITVYSAVGSLAMMRNWVESTGEVSADDMTEILLEMTLCTEGVRRKYWTDKRDLLP